MMTAFALVSLVSLVSLVFVAASVVLATIAAARTGHLLAAVPLMLELWVAAGLLRLTQSSSWTKLAAAAALIGIRMLVGFGLRRNNPILH